MQKNKTVSIDDIKNLREETGVSVIEVKKALDEAGGDVQKAKEILRLHGKKLADKKTSREAKAGVIESYLHPNFSNGVLLDIRCESDFVSKSPEFRKLAHEICLQIAAMKPLFVAESDIPENFLEGEIKIYEDQVVDSGKPEAITKQIVEGKLQKYKDTICLINQSWVKDDSKTIKNLIEDTVAKVGENIEVKKFARYEI